MKCLLLLSCVLGALMFSGASAHCATRNVTVEVSIVTDFGLFKKWVAFYRGRYDEALQGIKDMYANVYKTVRDRFWGVEIHAARFDLRLTNTFFSRSAAASAIIETDSRIKRDADTIYGGKAAEALKKFIADPNQKSNSSDVNILVTGYQLDGGLDSFLKGSLIEHDSVNMVITEVGMHRTADILTRRLTEALGGFYDLLDDECGKGDYIMAPDRMESSFKHIDNLDKFSKCTLDAFELNFKEKIYPWDKETAMASKTDVDMNVRTYPIGVTYSAMDQCKFMYGLTSEDCTDDSELDNCIRLGCMDPSSNQCTFQGDQRAYDRTSCGDGEWCLKGRCVADEDAPPNKTYTCYLKNEGKRNYSIE